MMAFHPYLLLILLLGLIRPSSAFAEDQDSSHYNKLLKEFKGTAALSGKLDYFLNRFKTKIKVPKSCEALAKEKGPFNLVQWHMCVLPSISNELLENKTCDNLSNIPFYKTLEKPDEYFEFGKPIKLEVKYFIEELFHFRLAIRRFLLKYNKDNLAPTADACSDFAKMTIRNIRDLEDIVGITYLKPAPYIKRKTHDFFKDKSPTLLVNHYFKDFELKSGDIILTRGAYSVSAAIARITGDNGHFSHLAVVYVDPQTKAISTIEAHIEVGVKVFPLQEFLKDDKIRVAVFRHRDAKFAANAADKIFDVVTSALHSGKAIPYDFAMDASDRTALFCSEVGEYAYEMASKDTGRNFSMPLFPSTLPLDLETDFLQRLGVKNKKVFAPSDMDTDFRFDVVAEYRDFSRVRTLQQHDAAFDHFYQWMKDMKYELHQEEFTNNTKNIAWKARRMPIFSDLLKDKFPEYMSPRILEAVLEMDFINEAIWLNLLEADNRFTRRNGYPMPKKFLDAELEKLRKRDLKAYRETRIFNETNLFNPAREKHTAGPPAPLFHQYYRPKDEK